MTNEQPTINVGIDVSKDKLAVAIARGNRRDEVLISQTHSARKEIDRRDNGHCTGNGSIHVGYRPQNHARALSETPYAPNGGREVDGRGISDTRFVASLMLMPVVRQE